MANEEQLKRLLESSKEENGCRAWNEWRGDNLGLSVQLPSVNLRGANLTEANLSYANLRDSNLRGVNLSGANLINARLNRADLSHATLCDAKLQWATFVGVKLFKAKFSGAFLNHTYFSGGELKGADFTYAESTYTLWINVDLSSVIGIEEMIHTSPSPVGGKTLNNFKGEIPKRFLEGCGFQDWEIEAAKLYKPGITQEEQSEVYKKIHNARFEGPIPIGGVFISYSHLDKDFALTIEEKLKSEGVRIWRDEHDLKAGSLNEQIWEGLRSQDVVLLILSQNSTRSDWVESELEMARDREKEEGRNILCPIALDKSWENKCKEGGTNRQLWRTLKEKVILPFKKNKSDFEAQGKKLIDGLRENYQAWENN